MFKNKEQVLGLVLTVLISVFMVGFFVYAATTIGSDINTGGTITMASASTSDDFWLGNVTADDDDYLYMDASSSEYFMWDNVPGMFVFSDDVSVAGVSSSTGGFRTNDVFVVGSTGAVSAATVSATGVASSTGLRIYDVFIATSAGIASTTGNFSIGDHNATATSTLEIGGGSTAGCLKIRDADADAWTYCYTDGGSMICGTTNVCGK